MLARALGAHVKDSKSEKNKTLNRYSHIGFLRLLRQHFPEIIMSWTNDAQKPEYHVVAPGQTMMLARPLALLVTIDLETRSALNLLTKI